MAIPQTPPESPEAGGIGEIGETGDIREDGTGLTALSEQGGILRRRIERRLHLMRLIVGLEALWLESWAVRALILLVLAGLLSGVLPGLPGWLHLSLLVLAGLGLVTAVSLMVRRFRWPGRKEAIHRWEGGSPHRPLTASFDRLSRGGDPLTETLWLHHKAEARARGAALGLTAAVPEVATRDPWGLRVIPVLAFVVAISAAWQDPLSRLREAVTPGLILSGDPLTAEVWLTPPPYTGLPPLTRSLSLSGVGTEPPEAIRAWRDLFSALPAGTRLQLVVRSGAGPSLQVGDVDLEPELLDPQTRRWDVTLQPTAEGGAAPEMRLTSFWQTWLRWPVHVVSDQAPSLAWVSPPQAVLRPGAEAALTLPVRGDDDWGFTALSLEIRRDGEKAEPVALPVSGQPRALRSALSVALASHPWAGLEVQVRVRGQDAAGQDGGTEWAGVTLPERPFTHPVARHLISLRKALMAATLAETADVANRIAGVSAQPGAFGGDPVTFLALRVAALRVTLLSMSGDAVGPERQAAAALLWQTAVRIEDGRLAGTRDALDQARQALSEALERQASPEELQAAIAAVRQAAGAYINELLSRMEGAAMPFPQLSGLAMSADSIDRMTQALEDLARLGSTEAARQVMDQLSRTLSRLQSATVPDAGQMEAAGRMIEALKDVVRQQEALLQQTFGIRQDEPVRRKGTPSRFANRGAELGREQERLAQRLPESLGGVSADQGLPPSLAAAEDAMTAAATALRSARWEDALEAQADALSALKKGQTEALEALLSRGGPTLLMMPGGLGLSDDPTGRGGDTLGAGGQAIPDQPQRAKAWDLLQELRRRAGERTRPAEELEYLNRLLRLF